MGPIQKQIQEKISTALNPVAMDIMNESEKHAHHKGNPGGEETHFHLYIKSVAFNGLSTLEKHKLIYKVLKTEIPKIHAISLKLEGSK